MGSAAVTVSGIVKVLLPALPYVTVAVTAVVPAFLPLMIPEELFDPAIEPSFTLKVTLPETPSDSVTGSSFPAFTVSEDTADQIPELLLSKPFVFSAALSAASVLSCNLLTSTLNAIFCFVFFVVPFTV